MPILAVHFSTFLSFFNSSTPPHFADSLQHLGVKACLLTQLNTLSPTTFCSFQSKPFPLWIFSFFTCRSSINRKSGVPNEATLGLEGYFLQQEYSFQIRFTNVRSKSRCLLTPIWKRTVYTKNVLPVSTVLSTDRSG